MTIHYKIAILTLVLSLDRQAYMILRGHESVPHSRPYMVLLERYKADDRINYCCGFLLNEDFVMTAAHCQATSYKVFLGLHNFHKQNDVQHVAVEKSSPHKHYDTSTYENDIMLLKLSSKAVLSETVKPIGLAFPCEGSLPQSCVVSGWGRTEGGTHLSAKLLETNVTLNDNEQCAKRKFYCSEGETGPSEGDGGSPLVCEDGKVYGVASSISSNPGGRRSRYTKIPDYRDWIDSIMIYNGKSLWSLPKRLPNTSDTMLMKHHICVKRAD